MTKLMIVVGSVRPGRIGLPIAQWVRDQAESDGRFEVDFADLGEIGLPFMDEPKHPRLRQYTHQHTIDWSRRVEAADAFVFVTPEYNHSYSPALKNALDFLFVEWSRKPVAFVAYGGVSGGTRGLMAMAPVIEALGLVRAQTNVEIHGAGSLVKDGAFAADERLAGTLGKALTELNGLAATLGEYRARS
ncbi:hypothetical protein GCM10010401_18730 [Rarobacter faecitabidus]|uniref:NAD(P)H-dependent FMN reductase n=1 Tax=Rarobacter faecitabidus TaxID=13243 RepID=A0A542ZUN8_RARFA|nr:NAD(P)H-dependent oxidoreductase [Rarobacter faecitabidus]TQL64083.1 NAD(P)H-dependent FMN reductase [Rarobacter faecitabidus]